MDSSPRPDTAETLVDGRPPGAPPAPAPERIGAYRIEGRLGLGGMGEVLLAWDERLERRVAIKRIRQDAGLSPEQRERFRREARLAIAWSWGSPRTDFCAGWAHREPYEMTERIGVYRMERPIGQGGMGEVVLAWPRRSPRCSP